MAHPTAIDRTNSLLRRYKYVEMRDNNTGGIIALFRDVVSSPVMVMAGGFAMAGAQGPITHDVISLTRKLEQLRGLEGLDEIAFSRWEKALAHMRRCEQVRAERAAKRSPARDCMPAAA